MYGKNYQTGFIGLESALSLATITATLTKATTSTIGTIKSLDLAEEKQKIEEEILLRRLELDEKFSEKQRDILSLQIKGEEAQQEINSIVQGAIAEAQKEQANTLVLEERIKQQILAAQAGFSIDEENKLVKSDDFKQPATVPQQSNSNRNIIIGGVVAGGTFLGFLYALSRRKKNNG